MADYFGNIPIQGDDTNKENDVAPIPPRPPRSPKTPRRGKPSGKVPRRKISAPFPLRYIAAPFCIIVLFCLYYGLSVTLVPRFFLKSLPQTFRQETGLTFSTDKVIYNPLNGKLLLTGITIQAPDNASSAHLLSVDSVQADVSIISLLRHGFVAKTLLVSGADIQLKRKADGSYNVSQLFDRYRKKTVDGMAFADLPFNFSLNNITIKNSALTFDDAVENKQHKIEDIELSIPTISNFSYDLDDYIEPAFSAIINGSHVNLVSDAKEAGKQQDIEGLSYSLDNIDIPLYAHYLPLKMPFEATQGKASGEITLTFHKNGNRGLQLFVRFSLDIKDSIFVSKDKSATLKTELLSLKGSAEPFNRTFSLDRAVFKGPIVTLDKNFSSDSITSFKLQPQQAAPAETTVPPANMSIKLLVADEGELVVTTSKKTAHFKPVEFSLRDFSTMQKTADDTGSQSGSFRIHGQSGDAFGTLTWQGSLNGSGARGNFELQNGDLSQLAVLFASPKDTLKGRASLKGTLSCTPREDGFIWGFEKGTLALNDVSASENGNQWISGRKIQITDIDLSQDALNLGNMSIEGGNLTLRRDKQPALINALSSTHKTSLKGIDFSGDLSYATNKNTSPILLKNAHLEFGGNQQKSKENFILTATTDNDGAIMGKGILALFPLQGKVDVSFTGLAAPTAIASFYDQQLDIDPSSRISGNGTLDPGAGTFSGDLTLNNAIMKGDKRQITFSKGIFEEVFVQPEKEKFSSKAVTLENLQEQYKELQVSATKLFLTGYERTKKVIHITSVNTDSLDLKSSKPPLPLLTETAASAKLQLGSANLAGTFQTLAATPEKAVKGTFSLECQQTGTSLPKNDNAKLTINLDNGGTIAGTMRLSLAPLQSVATLQLSEIKTQDSVALVSTRGVSPLVGTLGGEITGRLPETDFTGNITLTDATLASNGTTVAKWPSSTISGLLYSPLTGRLLAKSVSLDKPAMVLKLNEGSAINAIYASLEEALVPQGHSATSSLVTIDTVTFTDGTLSIEDHRFQPISGPIKGLSATLSNFHLPLQRDHSIDFQTKGRLGEGPFSLIGKLAGQPDPQAMLQSFSITDYQLSQQQATELHDLFKVDLGTARINLEFQTTDETENAQAQLQIALGKQTQNTEPSLFAALLIDNTNTISQTIPLRNDHSPLQSQCIQYFLKEKVKSEVSPLLLLPPEFKSIAQESTISFTSGEASLQERDLNRLKRFASLLRQRPYIPLSFSSVVNPVADRRILQQRLDEIEHARIQQENKRLEEEWKNRQSASQSPQQTTGADGTIEVRDIDAGSPDVFTPLVAKPQYVSDDMLFALGKERQKTVQEFFRQAVAPQTPRIYLNDAMTMIDDIDSPRIMISIGKKDS